MGLKRRDGVVAVCAMAATMAAVAAVEGGKGIIGSSVYDVFAMTPKPTAVGNVRQVLNGPTATLDNLEIHVTTLDPGKASHPPHKHPNEELIIIREGTVETLSNGEWKRLGPGAVILNGSGQMHDLKNVGTTPAVYHVINWRTEKTPKE